MLSGGGRLTTDALLRLRRRETAVGRRQRQAAVVGARDQEVCALLEGAIAAVLRALSRG